MRLVFPVHDGISLSRGNRTPAASPWTNDWFVADLQPLQLIFYGDDIVVEQFQGDCQHPGCASGPAVFKKYFGEWRSAAFGITGAPSFGASIQARRATHHRCGATVELAVLHWKRVRTSANAMFRSTFVRLAPQATNIQA